MKTGHISRKCRSRSEREMVRSSQGEAVSAEDTFAPGMTKSANCTENCATKTMSPPPVCRRCHPLLFAAPASCLWISPACHFSQCAPAAVAGWPPVVFPASHHQRHASELAAPAASANAHSPLLPSGVFPLPAESRKTRPIPHVPALNLRLFLFILNLPVLLSLTQDCLSRYYLHSGY